MAPFFICHLIPFFLNLCLFNFNSPFAEVLSAKSRCKRTPPQHRFGQSAPLSTETLANPAAAGDFSKKIATVHLSGHTSKLDHHRAAIETFDNSNMKAIFLLKYPVAGLAH